MRHSPKSSSSSWYVFVWMLSAMGALPKKSLMPKVLPLMRFVFLPEKRTIIKTARSRDVRLRPLRDTLPQACATKRSPKLVKKREKGRPYDGAGEGRRPPLTTRDVATRPAQRSGGGRGGRSARAPGDSGEFSTLAKGGERGRRPAGVSAGASRQEELTCGRHGRGWADSVANGGLAKLRCEFARFGMSTRFRLRPCAKTDFLNFCFCFEVSWRCGGLLGFEVFFCWKIIFGSLIIFFCNSQIFARTKIEYTTLAHTTLQNES